MGRLQNVVISHSVKLVSVVSSNQNRVMVLVVERALSNRHVAADSSNLLVSKAFSLVPGPDNHFDIWFGR